MALARHQSWVNVNSLTILFFIFRCRDGYSGTRCEVHGDDSSEENENDLDLKDIIIITVLGAMCIGFIAVFISLCIVARKPVEVEVDER